MSGRPNDERHFVHGFILGVGGSILSGAGSAGSFLPGSSILKAGGDLLTGFSKGIKEKGQFTTAGAGGGQGIIGMPAGGQSKGISLPPGLIPKGPGGIAGLLPGVPGGISGFAEAQTNGAVCSLRGFHLNRSSYFLRDGTFVPRGTKFVRNRTKNKSNGRANDSAIKRLDGAQDQAKKVLKATGWRTISKQSSREIRSAKKVSCK